MRIAIIYTDKFSERNIRTSGLLEALEERGCRVTTYDETALSRTLPCRAVTELKRRLHVLCQHRFSEIHAFKKHLARKAHHGEQHDSHYDRYHPGRGFPWPQSRALFNALFACFVKLPSCVRQDIASHDLVFMTNAQELVAQAVLTLCAAQGAPVVTYVNSWDHLTHRGKVIASPAIRRFLVWNAIHVDELARFHDIPREAATIVGALQADGMARDAATLQRETLLERFALPETARILFLPAYNARHGAHEPRLVQHLLEAMATMEEDVRLLIRPYPRDETFHARFGAALAHSLCEAALPLEDVEADRALMALLLKASDVTLSGPGTAAIEAMYYDTPVVFLAIDEEERRGSQPLFKKYYFSDHFQHIMKHDAAVYAETCQDMIQGVQAYLRDPGLHRDARRAVVLEQFGFLDGAAHQRIADVLCGELVS